VLLPKNSRLTHIFLVKGKSPIYLDYVDTLEGSDPARRLLISIVAQTQLSIAIVAPTIDLQKTNSGYAHTFIRTLMEGCFLYVYGSLLIAYCKVCYKPLILWNESHI